MLRGRSGFSSGGPKQNQLEDALEEVKARQQELNDKLSELENSHNDLADSLAAEGQRLDGQLAENAQKVELLSRKQADDLQGVREASEQGVKIALDRLDVLAQEVIQLRSELTDALSDASARQDAATEELRASLASEAQRLAEAAERQVADVEARCLGELSAKEAKISDDMHDLATRLSMRCEVLTGGMDSFTSDLDQAKARLEDQQRHDAQKFEADLQALRKELQDEFRTSLRRIEEEEKSHFEKVEREVQSQLEALKTTTQVAESIFTRSLVWQARGFKHRLHGMLNADDQTIRSPGLFLSSLPEMRLEIQLAARDDTPESALAPSLPLPGSCSIGLWAPPGLRIVFRLTLGEGSAAVTRRLEHTFEVGELSDEASRSIFVVQNFCRLNQVWVRKADTIRVFFELLDFQCAPIPAVPSLAVTTGGHRDDATAAVTGGAAAPEAAPGAQESTGGPAAVDEQPPAEGPGTPDEVDSPAARPPPLPDSVEYLRSFTAQEVVHERLSSEVQAVKNRSVRHVEWRLEGCSRLLDCRVGEAIDSPIFSAAGLEKIQFHFYPRDVSSSGTSSQPCALYVSGPVRTTLKGMLWVGSFSRQLEHRYQRRGDTAGRSRFCLLEKQVDCDDSVVLGLDIVEVEADLPDQSSASLCLRDARPQAGAGGHGHGGAAGGGAGGAAASQLSGTRGTLRMKREDPSKTEEFVRCVSLPTLNARALKLPMALKSAPPRTS